MRRVSRKTRRSILHITPHLGGGVGRVLLNYIKTVREKGNDIHRILSLDYANDTAIAEAGATGFFLEDRMSSNPEGLLERIAAADVVLIHWWNHPLLNDFLVRRTLPPARIVFWSHISGFHAPYVYSRPALDYPDLFIFTSPLSLDVPEVKRLPSSRTKALRTIWSTGGIDRFLQIEPKPHRGFHIGYIGTVDYDKMNRDFLKMSSRINIPDAVFTICGGPSQAAMREESGPYDPDKRFVFAGPVDNLCDYLSEFDIFGYPLAPDHWGTCEQSLGESMAAGVPPVVLANSTERYIIEHGISGIVAADNIAYCRAIEELYGNPKRRRELARNARRRAEKLYSLDLMVERWEGVFEEAFGFPKKERNWTGQYRGMHVPAFRVFLESIGDHGGAFRADVNGQSKGTRKKAEENIRALYASSHLWRSKTRGTPHHYHSFFPEDSVLRRWSSLAESVTV